MRHRHGEGLVNGKPEVGENTVVHADESATEAELMVDQIVAGIVGESRARGQRGAELAVGVQREKRMREPLEFQRAGATVDEPGVGKDGAAAELDRALQLV